MAKKNKDHPFIKAFVCAALVVGVGDFAGVRLIQNFNQDVEAQSILAKKEVTNWVNAAALRLEVRASDNFQEFSTRAERYFGQDIRPAF